MASAPDEVPYGSPQDYQLPGDSVPAIMRQVAVAAEKEVGQQAGS